MNGFERDLKGLLERASVGVDPRREARAVVLKRARRRRVANAVAVGVLSLVLVAGAFAGGDRLLGDVKPRDPEVARRGATDGYLELPRGEHEIARGSADDVPWALSSNPDASCLTVTLGRPGNVVGHGSCEGRFAALNVTEVRYSGRVFAVGSVGESVEGVELRAVVGGAGEADTAVIPVDLHDPPDDLRTDHRFFVAAVPPDSEFAAVVADQAGAPTARTVVTTKASRGMICRAPSRVHVTGPRRVDDKKGLIGSSRNGGGGGVRRGTAERLTEGLRRAQQALTSVEVVATAETCSVAVEEPPAPPSP